MKERKDQCMRVAAININGCQDEIKRKELVNEFDKAELDVLGVSETHIKGQGVWGSDSGEDNEMWRNLKGGCVWAGRDEMERGRGKEGCAVLVSERVWKGVTESGNIGSRGVWIKGKVGLLKYAWVCVYAPVNGSTKKDIDDMNIFWMEVNACLESFENDRRIILMGDMNARVGGQEIDKIVGKYGIDGMNENGEMLINICAERCLFLANTFFEHKLIHRFTWVGVGGREGQKSMIDFIAADERIRADVVDAKVVRGLFSGASDHFPVLMKVRTRGQWIRGAGNESVRRVRTERLNEEQYKREYMKVVNEKLGRKLTELEMEGEERNLDVIWRNFKEIVLEVVENIVGYKTIKKKRKRGDPWWSEEIKKSIEEKKKLYKKTLDKSVREEERTRRVEEYKACKNRVKQEIRESKRKVREECGRKLGEAYGENKKLFYQMVREGRGERKKENIKEIKDENGNMIKDSEDIKKRWGKYFENLMNVNSREQAMISCMGMEGDGRRPKQQQKISIKEVKKALQKLKGGKSPGVDGITAEMLKYGGEMVVKWMHLICTLAWEKGIVPDDWIKAIIVPIYKGKGDRKECGSYRGISLLSIPGKVYGRVLIVRVMEITDSKISQEQGGFRKGRGCIDQIFTVKSVAEKYINKGRKLYAAFIDLEKAYDRVDREGLWDVLRIYGVGGQLLNSMRAFYECASACVRVDGETGESFEIKVGVRQGCVMSPWLFNIYMDGVVREMKAKIGKRQGAKLLQGKEEWWLVASLFADDTVLLAESKEELQKVVNEFCRVCERRKLKVNAGKSKVMVFERKRSEVVDFHRPYRVEEENVRECEIEMNGEKMEEVTEFKYLGATLCKNNSMKSEIRERAVQGRKMIGALNKVCGFGDMDRKVKKGLRDSILLPTLTYGSELWTWGQQERSKIQAVEMSYLRSALGVTRWDEVGNEEVYRRFGMSERGVGMECGVVEWVKRGTLRWYGHVQRMEAEVLAKKAYDSNVEGRGVRGRPPASWDSRVEEYVRERGVNGIMGMRRVKERCKDRNSWRLFCQGHPLEGTLRRGRGVSDIDR